MNGQTKSKMPLVVAFLVGVALSAAVVFGILGQQNATQNQGTAGAPNETAPGKANVDSATAFPSWQENSASLKELVAFVKDATDKSSPNYVEPADRIATFDMDGTILCEKAPVYFDYCLTMHRVLDDPSYNATLEERTAMEQTREHAYANGEVYNPRVLTRTAS